MYIYIYVYIYYINQAAGCVDSCLYDMAVFWKAFLKRLEILNDIEILDGI